METVALAVLLVNAAATWAMVGLIWFVQLVHYPLFARYDRSTFPDVMTDHQQRTTLVVAGPMVVELVTAVALLLIRPTAVPGWQAWLGVGLVGVWAVSTAAVQVPLHDYLERHGWDAATCRRLVASNWVRTAAWSARGVLCGVMGWGVL